VVITTPTIYKSFIRKYAALSALNPALLRHSHRHKAARIGVPLRFQGATFHFTYTLHSIPCVGFRVEWRGRSMVFTGDHFNKPEALDKLQEQGVLSRARADDLRNLPLQETDLLLHEAGAPPIHTPLDVLMKLPPRVKNRMYVVHTSALPKGCDLRVAPTGTAGTIRLDKLDKPLASERMSNTRGSLVDAPIVEDDLEDDSDAISTPLRWSTDEYEESFGDDSALNRRSFALDKSFSHVSLLENENQRRGTPPSSTAFDSSYAHLAGRASRRKHPMARSGSIYAGKEQPLVSLRPTSSTDAWFTLNLLSAVPFLSR